jgi:hypothetical protein
MKFLAAFGLGACRAPALSVVVAIFGCGAIASADDATLAKPALDTPPAQNAPAIGVVVPAGTRIRFHLDAPLSSAQSTTGQRFTITLLDPILFDTTTIAAAGAHGDGTVLLAGHAGTGGHEGDLTLRLDTVDTPNGNRLACGDTRVEINGTNRKVAAALLGFVPFAGIGARLIRGREIRIGSDVPVLIVTDHPSTIVSQSGAVNTPLPLSPVH